MKTNLPRRGLRVGLTCNGATSNWRSSAHAPSMICLADKPRGTHQMTLQAGRMPVAKLLPSALPMIVKQVTRTLRRGYKSLNSLVAEEGFEPPTHGL